MIIPENGTANNAPVAFSSQCLSDKGVWEICAPDSAFLPDSGPSVDKPPSSVSSPPDDFSQGQQDRKQQGDDQQDQAARIKNAQTSGKLG